MLPAGAASRYAVYESGVQMKIISYGGGVQSTAMIVLATQGKIEADIALFSNVGDDSEHPKTLRYVREIIIPWATSKGFRVEELTPHKRGEPTSLVKEITREGSRRVLIPVYGDIGAPLSRSCTTDFKVRVIGQWARKNGANKNNKFVCHIGISVDEIERAGRGQPEAWQERSYPLLDLGLRRSDCEQVIRDAGLPVPPKSSCFFCPFHRPLTWSELRRDEPELFEKAQELEDHINNRQREFGRNPLYLTKFGGRLSDVIAEAQQQLFEYEGPGQEGCDSGFCWT